MKLKDLEIGVHVFDVNRSMEFRVAAQNHPGYEGCTTLLLHEISDVACLDASEPERPWQRSYFERTSEFGCNCYRLSNLNAWLNSDEDVWYAPNHPMDAPPKPELLRYGTFSNAGCPGYLQRLSPELRSALVEKDIPVLERIEKDHMQLVYVKAKVFLPSRTEMNKGDECGIAEGRPLPIFYDLSTYRAKMSAAARERYGRQWNPAREGAPYDTPHIYDPIHGWWYWMRTPSKLYSFLNRVMYTYGAVGYTYANNDCVGIRPLFNVDAELEVVRDSGPVYSYEIVRGQDI